MYAAALSLHLLAAIVWIGGMFFAYVCLRPSLGETLEPPAAARLLAASFGRFFRWVWLGIAVLLTSGFYMALTTYNLAAAPWWLYLMIILGITMMLLFAHVYFAPFQRLRSGLAAGEPEQTRAAIGAIRKIVGINLALGLFLAVSVSIGRYL